MLWLVIQSSQVQTILVSKVTSILHSKTGINISVGAIDFRPFNRILLKNVYIADLNNDTLIHAETISLSLLNINLDEGNYKLNRVVIDKATINFISDTSGLLNLTALLDKLPEDTVQQSDSSNFILKSNHVSITNSSFRLKQINADSVEYGVNVKDLHLDNLNIDVGDFCINADTIAMAINAMNFKDHSGFQLDNLRANFNMCNQHLNFGKLRIQAHGSSLRFDHMNMEFSSWKMFSDFVNKVRFDADFTNSYIKTSTVAYFVPTFRDINMALTLNGSLKGPVSNFRGKNITITTGAQSTISTSFTVTGLPNIDQTLMVVDIKELSTTRNDLTAITGKDEKSPLIEVPSNLDVLGKMTYRGNFTGYINDFVAYGTLKSAIGGLAIDLSFVPDHKKGINFNGNVNAINLDIGKLAQTDVLGRTTFHAKVKGNSDEKANVSAFTDATIKSFVANNYNYSGIEISGNLSNKTYIGSVHLNDPNCKLNFLGKIDFADSIPVFDFSAFVPKIDLVKLNLNTSDSISQASFLLTTKFTGSNLDNSKGEIKIVNSSYKNQRGEFKLSDIVVNADNTAESKIISLKSEFAEGEIRSKYNYSKVFAYLADLVYKYVPTFAPSNTKQAAHTTGVDKPEFNDYLIKFRLKKTQKITTVLAPDISIAENSSVFGILNPDLQTLTFKIKIPEVQVGSTAVKDLSIDGQTKDSMLVASITTPTIKIGESQIRNFKINTNIKNNTLNFSLGWMNPQKPSTYGLIEAIADFNESGKNGHIAQLNFKPSSFVINDSTWQLSASSLIIDSANMKIDNFMVSSQDQQLSINGSLSANEQDTLAVNLQNLNLSYLNIYLQSMGYKVDGKIDGYAKVNSVYKSPTLFADIKIRNLTSNSEPIGNVAFKSIWNNEEKRMALNLVNEYQDTVTFQAKGNYYAQTDDIDIDVNINRIKLSHLSPLLEGNVSDLNGSANGKIKITGTTEKPLLNGNIALSNTQLTVDYLKTKYSINDNIAIENSDIFVRNVKIYDRYMHTAMLNGNIRTNHFKDFNLNLSLAADNFQCMNTTEHDNDSFYGTVYGSGIILINGKFDDLNLNIKLKTENKTAIFLPLPSGGTVEQNNFITFVNNDPNLIVIDEPIVTETTSNSNLNLTLELQVTPEAEAQIIIDKKLGDIIKANGNGNLKMEINPYTDVFKMFGNYNIEKGDYLFTLQGVINKKFRIESGSSITWNGDPLDATMDIKAVYRVKTSLRQLLMDERYTTRIPVDCQILLTQKLMSPSIKFNIDLPNADAETKGLVTGALNTEEKVNTQFLGLLVINSFIVDQNATTSSTESGNSSLGTTGLYNTASELLSNQLSNWMSQWSNNFDIGFNYRPGLENEMSSDQMELALSTQLLDDRVSINGNVDVGSKNTNNPIAGDFNIDVKLNKSGKLRLKAFARSNDDLVQTTQESNYTTGAGILYREDFNNFKDLWSRIRHTFKNDEIIVPLDVIDNDSVSVKQDSAQKKENFIEIK
ncbi:MAG: translocation/assembly module TamB domain-containing protein [Bacteroidales bacterium]